MTKNLKHIISSKEQFYILGIETKENVSDFVLLQIQYKDENFEIEKKYLSNNLEDVIKNGISKKFPVLLHFDGNNVISKSVENKAGYRNNLLFNTNPDDFYFYEYHQDSSIYVSVVRKDFVENFITQLNESELFVIHVTIGPFVMINLAPILGNQKSISSTNYRLTFENKQIVDFIGVQAEIGSTTIGNHKFEFNEVPLLAAFFEYKFPNDSISFDNEFLSKNKTEYKYSVWFKKAGIAALIVIIVALFVGHLLLGHYITELTDKQLQYTISQQTISKIENLKSEVELKEKILATSGMNTSTYLTKYVADIGNSIPDAITITSIELNPISKKIKPNEKMELNLNTILITGESQNDKAFNEWITKMKSYKWINKLDIVKYDKENDNIDIFDISINL